MNRIFPNVNRTDSSICISFQPNVIIDAKQGYLW